MNREFLKRWGYPLLALSALIGLPVAGFIPESIKARWLLTAVLIVAFILVAAWIQTGTVLGFVLDSRKMASLSQLQLAAWTILVLSAFATAAFWNVSAGADDPLGIEVPGEIWLTLGISISSFVASGMIKGDQGAALRRNDTPIEARASDILMAEPEGMEGIDFGKVQMLLFTVILLITYGAAIEDLLSRQGSAGALITAFPPVSGGMVTLLGLSHAGYLTKKKAGQ